MILRKCVFSLFLMYLLLGSNTLWAHSGSTAYLELRVEEDNVNGDWWLALKDLQALITLDSNFDDRITFGEYQQQQDRIFNYAKQKITVEGDDGGCPILWRPASLSQLDDGIYVHFSFSAGCGIHSTLYYQALFDVDDSHRAIAKLVSDNQDNVLVFSPNSRSHGLVFDSETYWRTILNYVQQGVVHILKGYDHLLFLLALLVSIVLAPFNPNRLTAFFKPKHFFAFGPQLLKVITAFTFGHSVTLVLATVTGFSPPINWVETIIALSVVLAGINIVLPVFRESSWKVAASFGLVHGFGFASVLAELGLSRSNLFVSLLSFNLGVEIGQLLIVILATPFLLLLAKGQLTKGQLTEGQLTKGQLVKGQWLPKLARFGAAGTAAIIGLAWTIQRLPM